MLFRHIALYIFLSLLILSSALAAQEENLPFPSQGSFKKSSDSFPAQTLTALRVTETPNGVNIEIVADGSIEYAYHTLPNPARLVLDFKHVKSQLTSQILENQYVGNIRCYELWRTESNEPGARVVFELKAHMKFAVRVHDSGLVLEMTAIEPPPQFEQPQQPPKVPDSSSSETIPERSEATRVETKPAETSPSQSEQQQNQTIRPSEKPPDQAEQQRQETKPADTLQAQNEQPAQKQASASVPPVSQPKAVIRVPQGQLDLEPTDADPALFFTVPANSTDYVLGPEDVIELKVLQMNELNVTIRIAGDGSITLPFLGSVQVSGLTAPELSDKIAKLLGEQFLQNPQVSVFVKEFNSQKISIIGSVQTPGTYSLTGPRTIIQMLAQAGGVRPDAGKGIFVFRQDQKGQSTRLGILRENLLMKGDPAWNIWLHAGDVVNIPPQEQISISLFGAVATPGVYNLILGSESTLLKAIARAGGLQRASKSGVKIKRKNASGKESILDVNLDEILSGKKPDIPLQDGDLVIIKESFF
ncbi:polysaccharide biosynthesis/export family protein [bacterium]|nr:polysaccharide biosynthesis/export family protein [bacterium]